LLTPLPTTHTQGAAKAEATRLKMLADVYGGGLAARAAIEKQILLRCVGVFCLFRCCGLSFSLSIPTRPHSLPPSPHSPHSPARLPGAGPPSSRLGYEALSGALDSFGPEDYLGTGGFTGSGAGCVGAGEAEVGGPGPHALAEAALGLGTAPVRRAGV
jgi:hypothetical protein